MKNSKRLVVRILLCALFVSCSFAQCDTYVCSDQHKKCSKRVDESTIHINTGYCPCTAVFLGVNSQTFFLSGAGMLLYWK